MIFTCKNMYHLEWQKIIRLLQFHLKKHSANISILSENTHFLLILKTERLNFAPSLSARIELWILRKLEKDKQTNKQTEFYYQPKWNFGLLENVNRSETQFYSWKHLQIKVLFFANKNFITRIESILLFRGKFFEPGLLCCGCGQGSRGHCMVFRAVTFWNI